MALTPEEVALIERHRLKLGATAMHDELMVRYYRGLQRVEQLGMAIPPEMRKFLVIANWCRTVVDTINSRQQMRSMIVPGQETADPRLRAILDASNFSAHLSMFNLDRLILGRGIMSVGSNEDDPNLPLVRVESPRQMSVDVDARRESVLSACRLYPDPADTFTVAGQEMTDLTARHATLLLPDQTIWADRDDSGGWVEVDRDVHRLGVVPVVLHLNRRLSGQWAGESQQADVIPFADAAARSLTNMQFAQEAHGVPGIWATGVKNGDFVDGQGKPLPQFEVYYDVVKMLSDPNGKWGQFSAADLKNFETAMGVYGRQASIVTGFPARYFGLVTANPPAEGAIHADESQLNRSVEEQNEQVGVSIGNIGALALRFATGEWPTGRRVHVDWFDPGTPTVSQREDALAKRRAAGVLSREGYWDELGWSEARKAKERAYFDAEERDPMLEGVAARLVSVGGAAE